MADQYIAPLKFKTLGDFGAYIRDKKHPTYIERAMMVYCMMDMFEAKQENAQHFLPELAALAKEANLDFKDLIKITMHMCNDHNFFVQVQKETRKTLGEVNPVVLPKKE